ncbi:MAG: hypothetical protein ACFFG0_14110, partial [Candidatus Thorarchaeota archaeon]
NAHRIQIIDTTTILQLQDDTTALFHPDVSEEIFYRHGVNDYQRSYFSKKVLDAFSIVKLRIQDTFRETLHESAYNIIKAKYSEDFGITQEEWLELVDSKVKDEHGAFTQEFEKIVDLCLKEQVFLNLIELSGAQDQDVDAIFSTLDTYLDENFGTMIEQLFAPIAFEAFIDEVINQFLNNIDNEGFVSFNVPTQEYFEDLISVQDSYKDELVSVYWGSPPPPEFKDLNIIEGEYKGKLDALSLFFYRIREYLIDQNIRDLPITDTLLSLHGPKDPGTYTRQHLTNVLKDLGLDDEKKLQDMLLNQKAFYKTLLEKIQYDIQNNPNSAFKDYSNALSGEIGSGKYLTEQELELVKRLDDVLNEVLGYVGYTLLKLGFITFDGNEQIEFQMPQDLTTLAKIIRVLGLDSIAELKTSYFSIREYLETLIWSIILSGHYMNLRILDNNGQIKIQKEYTYPGSHFLSGIYKNFMGNIPDSIYHWAVLYTFSSRLIEGYHFNPYYKKENAFESIIDIDFENIIERNIDNPQFKHIFQTKILSKLSENVGCLITDQDISVDEFIRNALGIEDISDKEILKAIRDNYKPDKSGRNLAFVKFDFEIDGRRYKGLIYSYSGIQLIPGTYYINEGGNIIVKPFSRSKLTQKYFALNYKGYQRWFDSERKIILSLEILFNLKNIENLLEFRIVSDYPFCPSCENCIRILGDYEILNNLEILENLAKIP